ncbi:MAG: helix-turn-helix domain-containing protein [Candidatus Limnocylindria bacterium]
MRAPLVKKGIYSPKEVAELAGVSTSTILRYIRSDKLYGIKISARAYRIPLASVIATFYPELKRPPKVVIRRIASGEMEARWRRGLRAAHAAYDRAVAEGQGARGVKRTRPRKKMRVRA